VRCAAPADVGPSEARVESLGDRASSAARRAPPSSDSRAAPSEDFKSSRVRAWSDERAPDDGRVERCDARELAGSRDECDARVSSSVSRSPFGARSSRE
jgi:hypothetical protein